MKRKVNVGRGGDSASPDFLTDFGEFLRPYTAEGNANPLNTRSFRARAGQLGA